MARVTSVKRIRTLLNNCSESSVDRVSGFSMPARLGGGVLLTFSPGGRHEHTTVAMISPMLPNRVGPDMPDKIVRGAKTDSFACSGFCEVCGLGENSPRCKYRSNSFEMTLRRNKNLRSGRPSLANSAMTCRNWSAGLRYVSLNEVNMYSMNQMTYEAGGFDGNFSLISLRVCL